MVLGLLTLIGTVQGSAQSITVAPAATGADVQNYVQNVLLGSCVTASNISFTGMPHAAGTFDGTATTLGLNGGVILTSGNASLAVGPDDSNSAGLNNAIGGDPDLTVLASGFQTHDASVLEFDFIPQSDTIRFNYVFGSEEYPEYVNSGYNDVFGFFISGPGISGPFSGGAQNIALLPGTTTPVAIDNVNNGYSFTEPATGPCNNCAFYVDNSSGPAVEYDAHTVVLTAKAAVVPCQTYHIKIAVADAGDGALDSGVFLEAGSFTASGGEPVELLTVAGVNGVYEGCNVGSFVFRRSAGSSNADPLTVGYNVAGTAIPGTDYTPLPGSITIPAGQDSVVLSIEALLDFTPEGNETVVLSLIGGGCSCTAPPSVSMDILDNDVQMTLSTSGGDTICQGQSITLSASTSGSIAPYSGAWDNGAPAGNVVSVSPTQTTSYTFTVSDGCAGQILSSTETVTVIGSDISVDDASQCLSGNVFNFSGGAIADSGISHFWDFGDGSISADPDPVHSYSNAGTYTVSHSVVQSGQGCSATASTVVQVVPSPTVLVNVDQAVSCSGGSDGALSAAVSDGTSPFMYNWLPGGQTSATISGLTVGSYTVQVTDANNCMGSGSATVSQSDNELPIALCQNASVQLNQNGDAILSATLVDNGSSDNCGIASLVVSPNVFNCSDVGNNAVVLTVTDINGNAANCNAMVNVLDTLSPVALCQDVSVSLDADGTVTVDAAQVDNGSSDNCALQGLSLMPGLFDCQDIGSNMVELSVTDVSGNVSSCTAMVTVSENTPPTALCQDVTVQLDASGTASVTAAMIGTGSADNCALDSMWVDPSTFSCADIGPNTVMLWVADVTGNVASCSAVVTIQDGSAPTAVCQDIVVQLAPNGTYTIVPEDVDAGSFDNCGVETMTVDPEVFDCSNLGAVSTTLTVTDLFGNSSSCAATVSVSDTVAPVALCQDVTIHLDLTGAAVVSVSDIDNGSADLCGVVSMSLDRSSFDCSDLGPNTVQLSVEDNDGNVAVCTAVVTVEDTVSPTAVCLDVTVFLDTAGTASVDPVMVDNGSFDNCGPVTLALSSSLFPCEQLGAQMAELTVTDAMGNTSSCVSTITVIDTVAPQLVGCPSDIQVDPSSATCSSPVVWTSPTAIDNCTVTFSGTHSSGSVFPVGTTEVTYAATDQSGNSNSCSFNVVVDASGLMLNVELSTYNCGYHISCPNAADGEATVVVSGGCEPYAFQWSDGQTSQTATGLSAGVYTVTVEDANGTLATDTLELIQPQPLTTENLSSPKYPGEVNVSCAGMFDASVNLIVSGGAECSGYSYVWSGPNGFSSTDMVLDGVGAGSYTVSVTDANGCTHADSIEVIEPEPLTLQSFPNTYNGFNVSCFGATDGFINLEVSGGVPGFQYTWSNGASVQDVDSLSVGTYSVLVADTNGCQASLDIELLGPSALELNVLDTVPVNCNGAHTGQFVVQAAGGIPTYNYTWSNGAIGPVLAGAGAGLYQVIATDQNGCSQTLVLEMTEPALLQVNVAQIQGTTCYGGNDGSASLTVSGGTAPYSYLWQPSLSSSPTATGLSGGANLYSVTDASGCQVQDTVFIPEPDEVVILTSADTTVCPGTVVDLFAEVTGGGGTYLITWEQGAGFGPTFDLYVDQTVNVSVTAVDQNGCSAQPQSVIVSTLQPVTAAFEHTVITPCSAPFEVAFTDLSSNANAFQWYFGNGDSSSLSLPTTYFDTTGTHAVTLVATSEEGCTDTLNSNISIDALPVADFHIPNPDGCFPIMVGHFNQSTGANAYFWDFGDGEVSQEGSPYHFYEQPGAYTVTLIASNQLGCADTLSVDSAVFAYPRPTAGFIPVQNLTEEANEFFFINTSMGSNAYFWYFGNGDISELTEPTYQFPEHGSYQVVLTAYNSYGCADTAMYSVHVDLLASLYVPNAMAIGEAGLGGQFLPVGRGLATYHLWIFDKWGNQLWESTELIDGSPSEPWDGRYKGRQVPMGSYTWKIEAVFKDGTVWEGNTLQAGSPSVAGTVTVLY